MLVIWGRDNSVNVQKALWCCEELALAYRRINAGGAFGVVDSPSYRRLNPNALVPTLDDNGFVLWESNTIVRYLCARYGRGRLWIEDPQARALADRWLDWMVSTFWPALGPLFRGIIRTPAAERNLRAEEEARVRTADLLRIVDEHLSKQAYLGGDEFSMGDIAMGCAIWRWFALPIERPPLRNVERWFEALQQRRAYCKIVIRPLT